MRDDLAALRLPMKVGPKELRKLLQEDWDEGDEEDGRDNAGAAQSTQGVSMAAWCGDLISIRARVGMATRLFSRGPCSARGRDSS